MEDTFLALLHISLIFGFFFLQPACITSLSRKKKTIKIKKKNPKAFDFIFSQMAKSFVA